MNIAVLLTCHNRKAKTVKCMQSLYDALTHYNRLHEKDFIDVEVYLTDDGCTDGTVEAVSELALADKIHFIHGDGNLYWAGGMREAWKEAMQNELSWEFYLLLNDDTVLRYDVFETLLRTHDYVQKVRGKAGLYSGICCDPEDEHETTYGGDVWTNYLMARTKRLSPIGKPQECDMCNANVLLISKNVTDDIGFFYEGYQHAYADYDYSIHAKKKGFPLYLTDSYCGACVHDHKTGKVRNAFVTNMSLSERKRYFNHPLHSNKDYLTFVRRNAPMRYPYVLVGRLLNIYMPRLYYKIHM